MLVASFLLFLFVFLIIGVWSATRSKKTAEDYLIAGKSVPAWLVGLSAVATNNSGFMFIGMIGLTYQTGLSSIWLMIGWIVGDLAGSLLAVRQVREAGASDGIHSYGGLLGKWYGQDHLWLRRLVGLFTLVFLSVYAAAQLKAGSKATQTLLDWDPAVGVVISALIVLVYSISGGIRASIWTDAAQSVVMIVGMGLLLITGLEVVGGWGGLQQQALELQPGYMHWFPDTSLLGILLFVLGWVFAGSGVLGQPHIMIRFMSLDDVSHINRMRIYYYLWFTVFYGATIGVGLLSRVILPDVDGFDAELALPNMAVSLLPDFFVGLVLAAMFAATMSTADSLILSCSAAVTRDFTRKSWHSLAATKLATAAVLGVAVYVALSGNESVFSLVLDAWGLLGSAFVPLVLVYAFGKRVAEWQAIAMVLSGVAVFLMWPRLGFDPDIYAVAPGIIAGFIVYGIAMRFVKA